MDAVLIAVGSELLHAGRRDTNTEWIGERIRRRGGWVRLRASVDDDEERIAALVRGAVGNADLVLLTGGLGPTDDDRTSAAVAKTSIRSYLKRARSMAASSSWPCALA